MHARQSSILESLRAIQLFLDGHPEELAPINASGTRKSLDTLVPQLTTQALDQDAGRVGGRGEASLHQSLRKELHDLHMKPIATIARARLRNVPEMSAFQLPPLATPSTVLVAKAGGMADAAAKHAAVFIERGLSQDFIAQLTAAATALSQASDSRAQSRTRSVGATSALAAFVAQARTVVRELDALVTLKVGRDERLIGEWRAAKRVHRKTGPATGSATPAPAGTSPTTPGGSTPTLSP